MLAPMPMLIYKPHRADSKGFVRFWSSQYWYGDDTRYEQNIGLELTEKRIQDLFEWKNGTPLSKLKQASLYRNFVERRAELDRLRKDENPEVLLAHFAKGGAIWRIFLLHCWQPKRFPIYDQHVHRAMAFLQTGEREEIPSYDPQKIESYCHRYLPFHAKFEGIESRSVDKALWAFGKFLKESRFPTGPLNGK
jgi:hypothetical protein